MVRAAWLASGVEGSIDFGPLFALRLSRLEFCRLVSRGLATRLRIGQRLFFSIFSLYELLFGAAIPSFPVVVSRSGFLFVCLVFRRFPPNDVSCFPLCCVLGLVVLEAS